jgi:hypothetical protein
MLRDPTSPLLNLRAERPEQRGMPDQALSSMGHTEGQVEVT